MKTKDAIDRFLKNCQERGLSSSTVAGYQHYLRHFAAEYQELPVLARPINDYLRKRGETPAHRGEVFKRLQAFYSYLEREDNISSPVPPKGQVGRPRKHFAKGQVPQPQPIEDEAPATVEQKISGGGAPGFIRLNLHIYLHQGSDTALPGLKKGRHKAAIS